MGISETIEEVLEFYRDASTQSRLDDGGDRASELLDKLHPEGVDTSSLEAVIGFAERTALGADVDEIECQEVLSIVQEFAE